jgi:hypothetical protein
LTVASNRLFVKLISIRWNYFVVSSSKPTEAAADASKLYVTVMRLGRSTGLLLC